jgi:uncharacterized glyoxalase superfamily protein PhnB
MAVRKSARKVKVKVGRAAPRKKAVARRASTKTSSGLRLTSVTPTFTVNDLGRSIDWYCQGLGFTVTDRWEHEGKLHGVMLRAGGCSLALSQDDFAKGRDREKGVGTRVYLATTQSVDALAERVRSHGGKIIQEPTDVPWAKRSFAVEDPDGFKLSIDEVRRGR